MSATPVEDVRPPSDFFVAGGTLRLDAPSYVERPADDELFELTLAGEFCYVLTPRQMGKSSLMVRTARRLREHGVQPVIIDLTSIGAEVSVEQWYLGLLTRIKARLRLPIDLTAWWEAHAYLSPAQRFTDVLRHVVLEEIPGRVAIFIDEIDTTLKLDFTDDFFAAIRAMYNARASDPTFERLTFVLLGVATPADLIQDRARTPFNVGQGIELEEFSLDDAAVLRAGLEAAHPGQGAALLARIFYWTHGHPYLTQKLCLAAVELPRDGRDVAARVDGLVQALFLAETARKEVNLQFVRDGVLTHPNTRRLLLIYRDVRAGKPVPDDERSLDKNHLKLLGLVKREVGLLQVRNEIYRHVFDRAWIQEHLAPDWVRYAWIPPTVVTAVLVLVILTSVVDRLVNVERVGASRAHDGTVAWVLLRRHLPSGEGRPFESPYRGTVYHVALLPPRLAAYPLLVNEAPSLCRCDCRVAQRDLVSLAEGDELMVSDHCQSQVSQLTIFQWNAASARYDDVGDFNADDIVFSRDSVLLNLLKPEHPRLVHRALYRPGAKESAEGWGWERETVRVEFAQGVPERILASDDPVELVVGFYAQYTDTAKAQMYLTDAAWAKLDGCAAEGCGCPFPRAEVANVWVRDVTQTGATQGPPDEAATEPALVDVDVGCQNAAGDLAMTSVTWTLVKANGLWRGVEVETVVDPTEAYLIRGNDAVARGDYPLAVRYYDMALVMNPDLAIGYLSRAKAYQAQGKTEPALADYAAALAADPNLTEAYLNRGRIRLELGQYRAAIADLTAAIERNPQLAGAYFDRGLGYAQLDRHAEAIRDFTATLRLDPAYTEAYLQRGLAHAAQGERLLAINDLRRVLTASESALLRREAEAALDALQEDH